MAGKVIVLSVTVTLLMGAGCSKNRGWLSRSDYAEMQHDPFMEPSEAVAKSSDRTAGTAGRASLDASDVQVSDRQQQPGSAGPKPILRAAATGDTPGNGRLSQATYPTDNGSAAENDERDVVKSYSGPALSDFLQKRQAAARDNAMAEQLPARTASSAQSNLNPAATHAALPSMSPEAESFSSFLTNRTDAVAESPQRANRRVQETAADTNDFASWAEQQKAEWSTSAESTRSTAKSAPTQARAEAQSVFQQARTASQEMADSMSAPDFDVSDEETATPLLQQKFSPPAATGSALSRAKAPVANDFATDNNPFVDSFEEFHSSGSAAPKSQDSAASTARSGNSRSSLDEGFRMDTGWKPAHLTLP